MSSNDQPGNSTNSGSANSAGASSAGRPGSRPSNQPESKVIPPFTVELGDNRNSGLITVDHLLMRLRGRWDRLNVKGDGPAYTKLDIPGIYLEVKPAELVVNLHDPLSRDDRLRETIEQMLNSPEDVSVRDMNTQKVRPMDDAQIQRTVHQMKSLVIEIAKSVHHRDPAAVSYIVRRGQVPSLEAAEAMDGRELYDPWSNNPRRPKFKDQAEGWEDAMDRQESTGGAPLRSAV